MRKINASEYVSCVQQGICVVDFSASWCGPCKMLKPVLEELEKEYEGISFVYVDVDEQKDLSISLQIMSVPTIQIFKDGKLVKMISGYYPKEMFKKLLKLAQKDLYVQAVSVFAILLSITVVAVAYIKTTNNETPVKSIVNISVANEAVFELEEDVTNLSEQIYSNKNYCNIFQTEEDIYVLR